MGGCATKPKVSKAAEAGDEPLPAPEPAKDHDTVAVTDSKTKPLESTPAVPETLVEKDVAAVVEAAEQTETVKEIVIDDKDDDSANKRKSLSNLFDKEKEEKPPNESYEPSVESAEPVKPEEPSAVDTSAKEPETESKAVETEMPLLPTEPEGEPAPAAKEEAPASNKTEQERPEKVATETTDAVEKNVVAEKTIADEKEIKA